MIAAPARLWLSVALAFCLAAPGAARGDATPGSLEEALEHFMLERASGSAVSVRVPRIAVSSHERARMTPSFALHPRQRIAGSVPVRITLSEAGKPVRSLVVSVEVEAARGVLVAARGIRSGEILREDAVVREALSDRRLPRDSITEVSDAVGLRARRNIAVGSVIRSSRLETNTAVRRGQRVKLLLESGSLRIESMGRAREEGQVGDWIEVEALSSRKSLVARVGSDGVLHVVP